MAEWVYHISLVIADADHQRILLLTAGEVWMLPRFTQERYFTHLYLLTRRINDEMGADMVVLRTLAARRDEESQVMDALLLMDNMTPAWMPPKDSCWVDRAGLEEVVLAEEWMRPVLENVLDSLNQAPSVQCPPWFISGWFAEASAWINTVLTAKGYRLLRAPEPFKNGAISVVLLAETSQGTVYFKVAVKLPLFGHEPKLTAALGALYPDAIPTPLAIDEARRWMLTANIGTELRESNPSPQTMETVIKTYARFQINTASQIDTLFGVGCLDRRLNVLASQIDGLLADDECCQLLNSDERAEWQASGERLKALCGQLVTYHLPYTLVHGDFHGGNIALQGDQIRFFDWTDACIAHPFFDLTPLIDIDEPEKAAALQEAYLAEWTAYEPPERLREACAIGMILGALHQAVSYQGIFNGIEVDQQADWAAGVPFFARQVMKLMKKI